MAKKLITFNDEKHARELAWLESQPNESATVRALILNALEQGEHTPLEQTVVDMSETLRKMQRQLDRMSRQLEQGVSLVAPQNDEQDVVVETPEQAGILDNMGVVT